MKEAITILLLTVFACTCIVFASAVPRSSANVNSSRTAAEIDKNGYARPGEQMIQFHSGGRV